MERAVPEVVDGDWSHSQALTSLRASGGTFQTLITLKGCNEISAHISTDVIYQPSALTATGRHVQLVRGRERLGTENIQETPLNNEACLRARLDALFSSTNFVQLFPSGINT